MEYAYKADMARVTGSDNDMEKKVQSMILAGVRWMDRHPGKKPKLEVSPETQGLVLAMNADGHELEAAVLGAIKEGRTEAMEDVAMVHVHAIQRSGWKAYVQRMQEVGASELDWQTGGNEDSLRQDVPGSSRGQQKTY